MKKEIILEINTNTVMSVQLQYIGKVTQKNSLQQWMVMEMLLKA